MSEQPAVFTLRVNQRVQTPNGPGIIQGREIDKGIEKIIVSHSPKDPEVSEAVREKFLVGIWVLQSYPVNQITPFK